MNKKDLLNCKYKNLKNSKTGCEIEIFGIETEKGFQTPNGLFYNKNIWNEV